VELGGPKEAVGASEVDEYGGVAARAVDVGATTPGTVVVVLVPGPVVLLAKAGDAETGDAETGDAETGDAETGVVVVPAEVVGVACVAIVGSLVGSVVVVVVGSVVVVVVGCVVVVVVGCVVVA